MKTAPMDYKEYLQMPVGYFWRWEDEAEVAAIVNGNTIAYREQLIEAVETLAPLGLPRFGTLLLVLIATNPDGERNLNHIVGPSARLDNVKNGIPSINPAMVFLKSLSRLPNEFKSGQKRLMLLKDIFEGSHNRLPVKKSMQIAHDYRNNHKIPSQWECPKDILNSLLSKDCKALEVLHNRYPSGYTISDFLRDLPQIPEEVLPQETGNLEVKEQDFVTELVENAKTFHVGSLIKRIWSGLNIPFHHALPSQQPLGGVSDLTNKGDFDRLLISEFANDDLVFMSRLANNEALYINREVPPQSHTPQRVILIDVSIKTWGTPRTVAFALALAIAKHPKTDIACAVFALGQTYTPIGFDTVEETINGLQILEACLHPEAGLRAFMKAQEARKNIEVIFISSPETLELASMQRFMAENSAFFDFLIQTDAEGRIAVFKKQAKGKKHVQDFLLPLDELWASQKIKTREETTIASTNFPILFPQPVVNSKLFRSEEGSIFAIIDAKNLLMNHEKDAGNKGWRLLYQDLPPNTGGAALGINENGIPILFLIDRDNKKATFFNIKTGEQDSLFFAEWIWSLNFIFVEGCFYAANWKKGYKVSLPPGPAIVTYDLEYGFPDSFRSAAQQQSAWLQTTLGQFAYPPYKFLNKITKVFINAKGNLVFNQYELLTTEKNQFMLTFNENNNIICTAAKQTKTRFVFGKEYVIEINRLGMLTLYHINSDLKFFVPTVLDVALGLASETEFAGNTYFLQEDNRNQTIIHPIEFWTNYPLRFVVGIRKKLDYGTSN